MRKLDKGKLPFEQLNRLLKRIPSNKDVLLPPMPGEDGSVLSHLNRGDLVEAMDPITFEVEDPGWHSVHVNANDIAACGATPRWYTMTILLPEDSNMNTVCRVVDGATKACRETGAALVGGHTEITEVVNRIVVCGHMTGTLDGNQYYKTTGAKPGNILLMTKGAGVEATHILANIDELSIKREFGDSFQGRASAYLRDPGISVLKEATAVRGMDGITAMHDVTEGGLSTAVREMASGAGLGALIFPEEIHIGHETRLLCLKYKVEPLGVISSGALLIAVEQKFVKAVVKRIQAQGVRVDKIGRFTRTRGIFLEGANKKRKMPAFEVDEITRVLNNYSKSQNM